MKRVFLLCLFSVLFWSPLAHADEPEDLPDGEDVIVAMKKGEPAPFDGQLFDINTAIRWGLWLKFGQERAELNLDTEKKTCQAELRYHDDINNIEQWRWSKINQDLTQRLQRSDAARVKAEYERDHPGWYESVWFGVVLGAVGATGLVIVGSQVF